MRRLLAYTEYTVYLEACTTGGCIKTPAQTFRTAEKAPQDQAEPSINTATSHQVY